MAYDEGLAQRARELLEEEPGFAEKKMFGGIGFLLRGNMACGVIKEDLIVRVGSVRYDASLKLPYTRKFDITGKPMIGWIMVSSEGYEIDEDLSKWIQQGVHYALSLPSK